jgi:hypothetical protein
MRFTPSRAGPRGHLGTDNSPQRTTAQLGAVSLHPGESHSLRPAIANPIRAKRFTS